MGYHDGVFVVADYNAADAFGAGVGVEGVVWGMLAERACVNGGRKIDRSTLFLNILSLAGTGTFCYCLAEYCHELPNARHAISAVLDLAMLFDLIWLWHPLPTPYNVQ